MKTCLGSKFVLIEFALNICVNHTFGANCKQSKEKNRLERNRKRSFINARQKTKVFLSSLRGVNPTKEIKS